MESTASSPGVTITIDPLEAQRYVEMVDLVRDGRLQAVDAFRELPLHNMQYLIVKAIEAKEKEA